MLHEGVERFSARKREILLGEGVASSRQYELLAEIVHGCGTLLPLELDFFLSSLKDGFHKRNSYGHQSQYSTQREKVAGLYTPRVKYLPCKTTPNSRCRLLRAKSSWEQSKKKLSLQFGKVHLQTTIAACAVCYRNLRLPVGPVPILGHNVIPRY